MSTAVWHELGAVPGTCTVCSVEGGLSMGEARFHRTLVERLRKQYCAPPARFVTCGSCGWRWSVRADDATAAGVARRAGTARTDDRAPRIPQPQGEHVSQRDWAYPRG